MPTTGVGKSWGKTLNVFDWGSLLARGSTQQTVFWIWSVFVQVASPRAMRLFWKIMKWSFNALFSGRHPSSDFHGRPYPPGTPEALKAGTPLVGVDRLDHYFCVIWRIKADGDFCLKDRPILMVPTQDLITLGVCMCVQLYKL